MIHDLHLTRHMKITWLLTGVVLLIVVLHAPAVSATNPGPPNFELLRADIGTFVPAVYQPSFLAKVEAAEQLLPAVQVPPNPCASFNILTALRNENQAVSGTNGYLERDAAVIEADIVELQEIIAPPNPC
ncbi:MAG TPA: hypothetical protein VF434_12260 [Promineifilum sp.]